jgi:hypothetical protein
MDSQAMTSDLLQLKQAMRQEVNRGGEYIFNRASNS